MSKLVAVLKREAKKRVVSESVDIIVVGANSGPLETGK